MRRMHLIHITHHMLLGMLLTTVIGLTPLPSLAESHLEADIATSSADFAQSNTVPSDACAGMVDETPRGQVLCQRQLAINQLQLISWLSEQSQLYAPLANGDESGRFIFEMDSPTVTRVYLAQQLARVKVLAGYARPYVRYLQTSDAGIETETESVESAYWKNTITALNNHVQFKALHGAVFNIEQLFLKRLHGLTWANCEHRFRDDAKEPEFGNDLFSRHRAALISTTQDRCMEHALAEASAALNDFFQRFNIELAGKYPFADIRNSTVAHVDTTRLFLTDYLARRNELLTYARRLSPAHQASAKRFFEGLDAFIRYWGAALGVKAAPQGLPIRVQFRVLSSYAAHDDQLVQWEISTGAQDIRHPNTGRQTLKWVPGHAVAVRFVLSSQSPWSVVPDPTQDDFIADGKSAAFVDTSPWALMSLIERHRPSELPATLPGVPPRYWLAFQIPLKDNSQRQTTAKVYVALMPDMPFPLGANLRAPYPGETQE